MQPHVSYWTFVHVTQALQELHWLPIVQRIDYKLCLLVYKSRTSRAPVYVSDMLTPATDVTSRAMRSSTNCNYFVHRTTLRLGDRAFSVTALEPGIGCHQN